MEKEANSYIPPFGVTEEILSLVAEVSEIVGHLSATIKALPSFQLRKTNRIRTIQSSLAIENNSLSVEQVTDILEGKRVLGAPDEILEVKNAIDAYKLLLHLNPFSEKDLLKAHKSMMNGLVKEKRLLSQRECRCVWKKRTCTSCTTGRQSAFFDVGIDCLK